jgi:hypothetical protein
MTNEITIGPVDVDLLREQRDWLLTVKLDVSRELRARDGIVNLLDHVLDVAEGHARP